MCIKVIMNLFFIIILFAKTLTLEFIGHLKAMKVPKDGQILDFNFYSVNLNLTFHKRRGVSGKCQNDVIKDKINL